MSLTAFPHDPPSPHTIHGWLADGDFLKPFAAFSSLWLAIRARLFVPARGKIFYRQPCPQLNFSIRACDLEAYFELRPDRFLPD